MRVRAALRLAFVCLALLATVASAQQLRVLDEGLPPITRHAFGNPLVTHYARSRTYHVVHYRLGLHFDQGKGEVFGDEVVTVEPFRNHFRELELDSSGLVIDSAALWTGSGSQTPLRFSLHDPHLDIDLGRDFSAGSSIAVHIVYHGTPETGLFFINPDKNYPNAPAEIWSQGEEEYNHYWFPCYDYPNDKATSEMFITVPSNEVAISNGALVRVRRAHGRSTFHWVMREPISSYLISVVVGPLEKVSDHYKKLPVDYYVPPGTSQGRALRSFHLTPDMIGFFATTLQVSYPWAKYDQSIVHNFTEGGMENASASTEMEWTLHNAQADADFASRNLVSHELAHQWFGDLVTTRDWADIWLNEGFATFMEALYNEHHKGTDAYRFEMWRDQREATFEDRSDYRRPIVDAHYNSNNDMFDETTYPKGAVVLDMLRSILGDRLFFLSLHNYLEAHRYGNVDTHDLEEAIRETSGQNLDWFFDEWVYKAGYPEFTVSDHYDAVQKMLVIQIRQTQHAGSLTPLFDMPVQLAFYGSGKESKRVHIRIHRREQTFYIALAFHPNIVDFDPNDRVYKLLTFKKSVPELIAQAEGDPAMMSRFWAVRQLGQTGAATAAGTAALIQVLRTDPFYGVRAQAALALGNAANSAAQAALLDALHDASSKVRAAANEALGKYRGNPAVSQALVQELNEDPSYLAQGAAARALAASGNPAAVPVLIAKEQGRMRQMVPNQVITALGLTHDPRVLPVLYQAALPGEPERVRMAALRSLSMFGGKIPPKSPELNRVVSSALDDSFEFVQEDGMDLAVALQLHAFEPELEKLATSIHGESERSQNRARQALAALRGAATQPAAAAIHSNTSIPANSGTVQRLQQRVHELELEVKQLQHGQQPHAAH